MCDSFLDDSTDDILADLPLEDEIALLNSPDPPMPTSQELADATTISTSPSPDSQVFSKPTPTETKKTDRNKATYTKQPHDKTVKQPARHSTNTALLRASTTSFFATHPFQHRWKPASHPFSFLNTNSFTSASNLNFTKSVPITTQAPQQPKTPPTTPRNTISRPPIKTDNKTLHQFLKLTKTYEHHMELKQDYLQHTSRNTLPTDFAKHQIPCPEALTPDLKLQWKNTQDKYTKTLMTILTEFHTQQAQKTMNERDELLKTINNPETVLDMYKKAARQSTMTHSETQKRQQYNQNTNNPKRMRPTKPQKPSKNLPATNQPTKRKILHPVDKNNNQPKHPKTPPNKTVPLMSLNFNKKQFPKY